MTQARHLMKTAVLCLKPDMPIDEAIELMRQNGTISAPVLNDDDTIAGILVESDVIKMFIHPVTGGKEGTTVGDFMTQGVITEQMESDIGQISWCLLNHHFRQVPIVCNGKFAGIISRKDLLRHMTGPDSRKE